MTMTTLRQNQVWHGYVAAGTRLYLLSGTVTVVETARFMEMSDLSHTISLTGEQCYSVPHSGWLQIQAHRQCVTEITLRQDVPEILGLSWCTQILAAVSRGIRTMLHSS